MPELNAGSNGVEPATGSVIKNSQTSRFFEKLKTTYMIESSSSSSFGEVSTPNQTQTGLGPRGLSFYYPRLLYYMIHFYTHYGGLFALEKFKYSTYKYAQYTLFTRTCEKRLKIYIKNFTVLPRSSGPAGVVTFKRYERFSKN